MTDIVSQVAAEIAEIPGAPSVHEIARVAIEAYQRALWPPYYLDRRAPIYPQSRRAHASAISAYIMTIVGKYLCDHGEVQSHREVNRELFDSLYASGAYIVTDADRAVAGLHPRDSSGLTGEQLRILEARHTEAMLRPMPPMVMPKVEP